MNHFRMTLCHRYVRLPAATAHLLLTDCYPLMPAGSPSPGTSLRRNHVARRWCLPPRESSAYRPSGFGHRRTPTHRGPSSPPGTRLLRGRRAHGFLDCRGLHGTRLVRRPVPAFIEPTLRVGSGTPRGASGSGLSRLFAGRAAHVGLALLSTTRLPHLLALCGVLLIEQRK